MEDKLAELKTEN